MLLIYFVILIIRCIFDAISITVLTIADLATSKRFKSINVHKNSNNMETNELKLKKVVSASATLQEMKLGMIVKIPTHEIKTSILRSTASKLKQEGYLFRVSDKGLVNETIVECIKTPEL